MVEWLINLLTYERYVQLLAMLTMSIIGYFVLNYMIQQCAELFVSKGFSGMDLNKASKTRIPESQGVLCGAIFLIILICFIPFAFSGHFLGKSKGSFPHENLVEYLGALLSISCMIFLGFADDALDLRWRIKLILPTFASLPLLVVYYVDFGSTTIILPKPVRPYFGGELNIGVLYYLYMGLLAVFCTNAINIYAGINGIEVGQSIVISASVLVYNLIELNGSLWRPHVFSAYLMVPFLAVCLALYRYNRYPARVFVGDTFCYFAGMTLAVVGIIGHFSKTLLLFFIPQVFNFLFSVPQLFHFIPCPRHRLPKYNPETDRLTPSCVQFRLSSLSTLGTLCLWVLRTFCLVNYRVLSGKDIPAEDKGGKDWVEISNLTIINLALRILGPTHEGTLTSILLGLQVLCSCLALFIRYPLAHLLYDA